MQRLKPYLIVGLLVFSVITLWYLRGQQNEPDDAFCEQMLAKGKSAEARAWALQATGSTQLRTIHELDNTKSLEIIQKLYELGAERVMACDIETAPEVGETTNILVVTLPADREARKRLLQYECSHAGGLGFDGVKDKGQRYMFLWWT
jgi:hypothetical protein